MKACVPLVFLILVISLACQAQETSPSTDQPFGSVEERRLLSALHQERQSLDQERQRLDEREKELKRLETEVDKKLDQLKKQRIDLEALLAEKDAQELQRVKDLSKMYEKMAADQAARVLTTLDEDLAIAILEHMKTKSAARILNNLDQEKAAALTAAFSTLDSN
jgi:flagellar motility protein MotE (MotC chaperone)